MDLTTQHTSDKELKAFTSLRCVSQHFLFLVPKSIETRIEFGQHRAAKG